MRRKSFLIFFYLLLFNISVFSLSTYSNDVESLKDIYDKMGGISWKWNESSIHPKWNFTLAINETNPCEPITWQGITCNIVDQSSILLSSSSLSSSISHNNNNITTAITTTIKTIITSTTNTITTTTNTNTNNTIYRINSLNLNSFGLYGELIPSISNLIELTLLDLTSNLISGLVPSEIGLLINLKILYIPFNLFKGNLPSTIGNLIQLDDFDLDNNKFTGSLPKTLGFLTKLRYLDLDNNYFSGSIPSELYTMTNLVDLDLDKNHFTGTIPSSFALLPNILYLSLDTNHLTGKIPSEFGFMTQLNVLLLQNNKLTGSIDTLLWQSSNLSLVSLDLSGNTFSHTIPASLFNIPNISILSLSVNCFRGPLPSSICSTSASIIAMDSLSSSPSCKDSWGFIFTNRIFFSYFGGSYPKCVTDLPNLIVLHLSGNGLGGQLGTIPSYSKLLNLSLTHNRLTGTIPNSFQKWPFLELDLSVNRLTGDLSSNFSNVYSNSICISDSSSTSTSTSSSITTTTISNTTIKKTSTESNCIERLSKISLKINRLSGDIPKSIYNAKRIDVLTDNIFKCGDLPPHDPIVDYYTCGSSLLDIAMGTFGFIFFILIIVILLVRLSDNYTTKSNHLSIELLWNPIKKIYQKTYEYIYWKKYLVPSSLPNLQGFNDLLDQFLIGIILLSIVGIIICMPIYIIKFLENGKENGKYSTHTYMYRWLFSLVFVSGTVPAILLIITWISCVIIIGWILRTRLVFHTDITPRSSTKSDLRNDSLSIDPHKLTSSNRSSFRQSYDRNNFHHHNNKINSNNNSNNNSNTNISIIGSSNNFDIYNTGDNYNNYNNGNGNDNDDDEIAGSDRATVGNIEPPEKIRSYIIRTSSLIIRAIINFIVVLSVHVAFVYLSATAYFSPGVNLVTQFSLGLFMLIWNNVVVPELILKSDPRMFVWDKLSIRVFMLLCNMIVIPCIATAFTRPSCFQYLIRNPDKISAAYSYTECGLSEYNATSGETICIIPDNITIDIQPALPPLIYNFQCGSDLLTDYIPVYIYTYCFLIILPLIRYLWFMNTSLSASPSDSLISKFASPGLMFPDQWRSLPSYLDSVDTTTSPLRLSPLNITNSSVEVTAIHSSRLESQHNSNKRNPSKLNIWNPDSLLSRLITHTAILLTFGICSPILSVAIVLAVILSILESKIMMGRYIFRRFEIILHFNPLIQSNDGQNNNINENNNNNNDNRNKYSENNNNNNNSTQLVAVDNISGYCDVSGDERSAVDYTFVCLEESLSGILLSTGKCIIMTVLISSLFIAGFCWDMTGDRIGWQEGIWAPICICTVPFLLIFYSFFSKEREILRPRIKSTLYSQNLQMIPKLTHLIRSKSNKSSSNN